jgi:predicted Ser/Thr protein kinase
MVDLNDQLTHTFPHNHYYCDESIRLVDCRSAYQIQSKLSDCVYLGGKDGKSDYIIKVDRGKFESNVYKLLDGSNICPMLLDTSICSYYDLLNGSCGTAHVLVLERYDGDLFSLLDNNLTPIQMRSIIQTIIDLSLRMNLQYGIRHGDLGFNNIVYRNNNPYDIRIIDFDSSTIYDNNHKIVKTAYREPQSEKLQYNPYWDLLKLESLDPHLYFKVPQVYRDHYYQFHSKIERNSPSSLIFTV